MKQVKTNRYHDCIELINNMNYKSEITLEELQRQDYLLMSTQSKLDNIYDEQQKAETYLDRLKSWFGFCLPTRTHRSLGGTGKINNINIPIESTLINKSIDIEECTDQMIIGIQYLKQNALKISDQLDIDKNILEIVTDSVDQVNEKQHKINKRF